ncbi:MAG TPA: hypothetical protein VKW06_01545 [Candidatus Angelobacter sp.]|nr:hypothetical protein [Candidatus Angelobacter sp.]
MTKPSPGFSVFVLIALSLFCLLSGCQSWSERGAKGLGTLPPAGPNETNFSPYQPAHPYQQLAKGLLGRKLHEGKEGTAAVQVHDFLVGPRQKTDSYSLSAASIFEVRSGTGTMRLGENSQQIGPGTVVPVGASQAFSIENQGELPIAIRVTAVGGQ